MVTEFQDLFPEARNPPELGAINDRCQIRTQEGHRVVIVSGIPVAQYAIADRMAEAHAMVNLVDQGWADQNDVARAFGCSARSVRRHQRRFEEGGLPALGRGQGIPRRDTRGCLRLAPGPSDPIEGARVLQLSDRHTPGGDRDGRAQSSQTDWVDRT